MIVAILDDNEGRQQAMRELLRDRYPESKPIFFDNAPDMVEWLRTHLGEVSLVCLDHDLGPNRQRDGAVFDPGTGRDVVAYLTGQSPHCTVIVHSSNPEAAPAMLWELKASGWTARRVIPFGDLEWVAISWAERLDECLAAGEKE